MKTLMLLALALLVVMGCGNNLVIDPNDDDSSVTLAVPTGVYAPGAYTTSNSITLKWNNNVINATRYEIRKKTSDSDYNSAGSVSRPSGAKVEYEVVGLESATTYWLQVKAVDFNNNSSEYSTPPVKATTL